MLNYRTRTTTTRIIIHDSHTGEEVRELVPWLLAKGRTMGLLWIGYHFVIERNGVPVMCRPHDSIGSHTPGHNHDAVSVCLAGGADGKDDFTDEQRATLVLLCQSTMKLYGPLKVQGDSEVVKYRNRKHDCPSCNMDDLRAALKAITPPETEVSPTNDQPELSQQNRLILDYLNSGRTLTNLIALASLGIGSLSSRVAELRADGYDINGEDGTDHHGKRYKKYSLDTSKLKDSK